MLFYWERLICFALDFLFSIIIAWRSCSMSYSYPLNKFWMEFLLNNSYFNSFYSIVSFSMFMFFSGGRTSGMKGDSYFFSAIAYQSTFFSQMWLFTSLGPLRPSRLAGFLYRVLLIKSAASIVHPSGKSDFFKHIYFEKIRSRISFLFFPR